MPTLRSRSVKSGGATTPSRSSAASSPVSPPKGQPALSTLTFLSSLDPLEGEPALSTLTVLSSLDPLTPAGEREQSFPPISPAELRGNVSRRRRTVEKKLQFYDDGVTKSPVRVRKRRRGGEREASSKDPEIDAVVPMEKGKRKVMELAGSDSEEDNRLGSDVEAAGGKMASSVQDDSVRIGQSASGNGRTGSSSMARGGIRARIDDKVNVNNASESVEDMVEQVQANQPVVGPNRYNRRVFTSVAESTKAKFLEVAQRRAAHFAHFPAEADVPAVPAVDETAVGFPVDEHRRRAAELYAEVSAGAGQAEIGGQEEEGWPGPFSTARQLVEGRAAAAAARQEATRAVGEKPKPWVKWSPSRQPHFKRTRVAISLHDMCVEVLCANIGHVQSLVGVPDVTKKSIIASLCARRRMTPTTFRLCFDAAPAEVFVPDCTQLTEEVFTEAIAPCPTQRLEVLELGLCGRGFSDNLCATTLAPSVNSMPMLHTLTVGGAYRFTDKGLTTLLHAAPNLVSLNLNHCNMISNEGVRTVAEGFGPKLNALSLESCSQLDALKILPALLKMSSLKKLSLSGISGTTDVIVSDIAVVLGPNLEEFSLAGCRTLTDTAVGAISLCCIGLRLLDLAHIPMLTDKAIERLANGCRSLQTLRLNRGKFSDTALAALVIASGSCLIDLSLNSVQQAGDHTLSALAKHSKGTLEQLDVSFCRTISDQALGLLADSCSGLHELRLFGCTQVGHYPSKLSQMLVDEDVSLSMSQVSMVFLEGHSNPDLNVIGLPNPDLKVTCLHKKPPIKISREEKSLSAEIQ